MPAGQVAAGLPGSPGPAHGAHPRLRDAHEVLEPLVELGVLDQEVAAQRDHLLPVDDLLVEQHQAAEEVVVHVLVAEGLAHLVEEGELVEGPHLAGLGQGDVPQDPARRAGSRS